MHDPATPLDAPDSSRAPEPDTEAAPLPPIPVPPGTKKWSREGWLRVYAEKGTVKAACAAVGISRETAYAERKRNPVFAERWEVEESAVTDQLEKTLVEVALEGEGSPQVRALEFALKARRPNVYRESINVKHGGKVNVEVEESVDDAIREYAAEVGRLTERLAEVAPDGQAPVAGAAAGGSVAPAS
jgi:hypothetical protein